MNNPKTTLYGYLLIAVGVAGAVAAVWRGQNPDIMNLYNVLMGMGLVSAKDGGR